LTGLKQFTPAGANRPFYCDTSTDNVRPYVPKELRKKVFHLFHDPAHTGSKPTSRAIKNKFVWPRMDADIKLWSRTCLPCQRSKVSKHTRSPLTTFQIADSRLRARPRGHCRPIAGIRRIPLLPNHDRPLHQVTRSNAHGRHDCRNHRQGVLKLCPDQRAKRRTEQRTVQRTARRNERSNVQTKTCR
jgi:hypothetical protein